MKPWKWFTPKPSPAEIPGNAFDLDAVQAQIRAEMERDWREAQQEAAARRHPAAIARREESARARRAHQAKRSAERQAALAKFGVRV
jgi:hypothetical protein